mmetsp:Transcript_102328/g.329966  ORF Transcript_102328/g.329966 Transcript_102328/m.329966 type:complete len:224 (-) Transcript_102328:305-976(-)
MSSRMMGATKGWPPLRSRVKLASQPGCHFHGRVPRVSGTLTSPSSRAPGLKKVAKRAMRAQPRRRTSSGLPARSPPSSRAWYASALVYSGSSSNGGGSSGMEITVSVTTSDCDRRWKSATSPKVPRSSTAVSQSPDHGRPSSLRGSRTSYSGKPRTLSGRSTGTENWPGATKSFAPGNCRAKGAASALCSTAFEGSRIQRTGPCAASSSLTRRRDSGVAATGA